jgi:hypothetical protein
MTDEQMREINSTAVARLARARGIPHTDASNWLTLAQSAFRRNESRPDYRDDADTEQK